MKKHKISRKLSLSKNTVANLKDRDMALANGGELPVTFQYPTCVSVDAGCQTWERCSCGGYCL